MAEQQKLSAKKTIHYLYYLMVVVLAFWWLPFTSLSSSKSTAKRDASSIIQHSFKHVEDAHELHFGDVHIYLPIILYKKGSGLSIFSSRRFCDEHHGMSAVYKGFKIVGSRIVDVQDQQKVYNLSMTKNVCWMILSLLLMLLLFIGCVMHIRRKKTPKGIWILPLAMVRFVRDDIAKTTISRKEYKKFTPYLLTIFSYVFFNNLLGLLPGAGNVTGNVSVTLTLALLTFFMTHWHASSSYWAHVFKPTGIPIFMYPILVPLEFVSMLLKPIILAVRLFANILMGHLLIIIILDMIPILNSIFASIIIVPLCTGMLLLKLFVAYMQAYIFTLFSAVSIGKAVEKESH